MKSYQKFLFNTEVYFYMKNLFIVIFLMFFFKSACFAINPKAIDAYNKGIKQTEQKKYEDALVSFNKALKIEPSFIDAYYNLGILQDSRGNHKNALKTLKKILKYNPDDYDTIFKIAIINYGLGNLEDAETYINQIPPENPNYKKLVQYMSMPEEKRVYKINKKNSNKNIKDINEINDNDVGTGIEFAYNEPKDCEFIKNSISGLEGPAGIAKDSSGNLYIADYSNNTIVFINNKGEKQVIARGGLIKGPMGLTIDQYNNLYAANYDSNEIVILPATGENPYILPIKVNKPYFLMIDKLGILYVSEQGNNSVSSYKLLWKH